MPWSQQQIDDLRASIATGQLLVRSGDRSVQYRSLDEMQRVLRIMESDVVGGNINGSSLILGRRSYASFRRD